MAVVRDERVALTQALNDILQHKEITLGKEKEKKYKEILTELLGSHLIPGMKDVDSSFKAIYERIFYGGSIYDGSKISEPDQFDLDIVLKLPSHCKVMAFDRWSDIGRQMGVSPGHVCYFSTEDPRLVFHVKDWKALHNLFIESQNMFHVSPEKVTKWFHGVLMKALNNCTEEISPGTRAFTTSQGVLCSITTKYSEPAQVITIKVDESIKFDINFVPVFYYFSPTLNVNVYLVPQPPQPKQVQWRISYSEKEKKILEGSICARKITKLLKRIRDLQGAPWKKLSSYHLKTFIILEIEDNWDEKHLGKIFLSLLNKLYQYLNNGYIPSSFDEEHNVLRNVSSLTLKNICSKLKNIIKSIEESPPLYIKKYFLREFEIPISEKSSELQSVFEKRPGEPSLNQVINDIFNEVVILNKDAKQQAKKTVTDLLNEQLIPNMKAVDKVFDTIFEKIFYTGSFYDGLKISEADEFDLNIVLRLPALIENEIAIYNTRNNNGQGNGLLRGYAFYCLHVNPVSLLHQNDPRYEDWIKLTKFFTETDGVFFLSPLLIISWFQSTLIKALQAVGSRDTCAPPGTYVVSMKEEDILVTTKASGPAWTLNVKTNASADNIDIDLVPVFYFFDASLDSDVHLVPKPLDSSESQWRMSFAKKEREILHGNDCAKKVIKLLKCLRDARGGSWEKLCSYHLKNFVILEIDNFTWNGKDLGEIFLSLLNRLQQYLSDGYLPSSFDAEHNVISNVGRVTIENISNRLKCIIKDIEKNPPSNMRKYFVSNVVRKGHLHSSL